MLTIAERLAGRPGETSGLPSILREVAEALDRAACFAAQVDIIVGFNERVPPPHGRASLTTLQAALVEVLGSRLLAIGEGPQDAPDGSVALALGMRSYGRIILEEQPSLETGDLLFGFVMVTADDLLAARRRDAEVRASNDALDEEIRAFYRHCQPEETARMLEVLEQGIDRIDPVLFYVEEASYSNMPTFNNLLKRGGAGKDDDRYLIEALAKRPAAEWPWTAQVLVYCFYHLRASGFRGEEFNSRQLTAFTLRRFFDETRREFARALGEPGFPREGLTLMEQAEGILAQRGELSRTHLFYRMINGLSLHKEQRLLPRSEIRPIDHRALPPDIRSYFERWDLNPSQHESLYELCRRWLERALAHPRADPHPKGLSHVEELIVVMAQSATEELTSDLGMSRCLREIGNIARVHDEQRYEEANSWLQTEYFCAVVPSRRMSEQMAEQPRALADVLKAVSARMRYNSWHYMPGHFPLQHKAEDRHFYMPPAMSDISAWSDQRHRGHVAAGVRHSIRSPGPITYKGKVFPGFYDLRLMRCEGPGYTLAELKRANEYTAYLGAFYQALLDHVVSTGTSFRVTAFTNQWYETP
jgi:hypothetical protein